MVPPFEWCIILVLTKISSRVGRVMDVKLGFNRKLAFGVSRVCIAILLTSPILSGLWISCRDKDLLGLDLKCELLSHIYYQCRVVVHVIKYCPIPLV